MIGIIDSGLGGLAIAEAIWKELPYESTLYLADHAYFPYGDKTAEQINLRLPRLINWLVKRKVKTVVIACNTITATAIDGLRQHFDIPFVGTEPAIKQRGIVLVTPTTAASRRYQQLAKNYPVVTLACPGLAEAIEHGRKIDVYLSKLPQNTKTVVLGCTHYILVKDKIQKIYGKNIKIIDPSAAIARQTRTVLTRRYLLNPSGKPKHLFYTTGLSRRARGIIFTKCSL